MLIHRLTDSVYKRNIHLVVGSAREMNDHLKSLQCKERVGKDCAGLTVSLKCMSELYPDIPSKRYFIWLRSFEFTPRFIAVLVHECYHCMSYVLEDLGVIEEDGGAEARAYYLDSLVEQCLTFLKETP